MMLNNCSQLTGPSGKRGAQEWDGVNDMSDAGKATEMLLAGSELPLRPRKWAEEQCPDGFVTPAWVKDLGRNLPQHPILNCDLPPRTSLLGVKADSLGCGCRDVLGGRQSVLGGQWPWRSPVGPDDFLSVPQGSFPVLHEEAHAHGLVHHVQHVHVTVPKH